MYQNKRGIDIFIKRCNDIIDGKYLLIDKNVSNLLKSIASDETICELMKNSLKDFDFEKTHNACKESSFDEDCKTLFTLPEDEKTLIAYVFSLLWQFDSKQMDFQKYLNESYVNTSSLYESYSVFCETVMKPFKKAVVGYINVLGETESVSENNILLEKFLKGQKIEFGVYVVDNLILSLGNIQRTVDDDVKLKMHTKQDMRLLCDGLSNAIISRDKKLIKLIYTGFYYAFKDYEAALDDLKYIEKVLKNYFII